MEMPLKRKYRVGKSYDSHPAKPRTGSSKRKNNRSARMRNHPNPPRTR